MTEASFVYDDNDNDEEEDLSCRLKLLLHAKALPLVGRLNRRPDCWCVVSLVNDAPSRSQYFRSEMIDETEIIQKCCNPHWTKVIWIDYKHGTKLNFRVNLLRHSNTSGSKIVGSALFEVSDVLRSNQMKVKRFPEGGVVIAHLRVVPRSDNCIFRFRLRTMSIKYSSNQLFGKRKSIGTILELARKHTSAAAGDSWVAVYRSSPLLESELPSWDVAEVHLHIEGDLMWQIRFLVWDSSRRYLIGSVETTLHDVMDSLIEEDFDEPSERDLMLLRRGEDVGRLRVIEAKVVTLEQMEEDEKRLKLASANSFRVPVPCPISPTKQTTFENFLEEGGEIGLDVAIDFTRTNGDPRKPESLHYILNYHAHNDYQEVIQEVGTAALNYSTDKECSMWGFGAKFGGQVRHIFQCGSTPTVSGVEGLQQAYRSVFEHELVMSGPTIFDHVIQAAAVKSRMYHGLPRQRYRVLLLLTDGISLDCAETKRKLSLYSELPLSIIVVGVGTSADFSALRDLFTNYQPACRRNTTVLELRSHQHDYTLLSRAALQNIPQQVVEYLQLQDVGRVGR